MIIKHMIHSGFIVTEHNTTLIFDPISFIDTNDLEENVYVFSSHSHSDHFNTEIMKDLFAKENIHFIFSKDIEPFVKNIKIKNLYILDHYENIVINDVTVSAYGSTDIGNSYLVKTNDKSFFHSGDLNWWHWKGLSPKELKMEEPGFKKEVALLKGQPIDYAFIPVDPRLEEYGYLAVNYFMDLLHPRYVIPMHSFGQYEYYKDLESHIDLKYSKLINVAHENEVLLGTE